MKIAVVTCNRADYSKLAPVLKGLMEDSFFQVSVLVMGSHLSDDYGYTYKLVQQDGMPIDSMIHTLLKGETEGAMVESMGLAMMKLPDVLNRLEPDLLMVQGDRFEALPVAIAAAVMNVRVVHLEGGEVSGNIDDVIRHSITKLSHYHICCNQDARLRIESMCEDASRILLSGCPAYDQLIKTDTSQYQEAFKRWLPNHRGVRNFIICLFHPVTTAIAESIHQFQLILDALLEFGAKTILLFPNVDAGSKELVRNVRMRGIDKKDFVHFYKHVPFDDFVYLMANCALIIGNSSAGIRESTVFGTPVINIGTRQNARMAAANVETILEVVNKDEILNLMKIQFGKIYPSNYIYGDGKAVQRIIHFLKGIDIKASVQKSFNFDRNLSSHRSTGSYCGVYALNMQSLSEQLALAVDLGGSFIRVALVNSQGEIHNILKTEMVACPEERIQIIIQLVNELLDEKRYPVVGVGVSTEGRGNSETGEILFAPKVLRTRLEDALGLPCSIENDGNCAALAEMNFGKSKLQDMALLHFGTGIGGGIVHEGSLWTGYSYSAGEFGHIVVSFDDERVCPCGNSGCLEAYAGGWALSNMAKEIELSSNLKEIVDRDHGTEEEIKEKRNDDKFFACPFLASLADGGLNLAVQHLSRASRAIAAAILTIYNSYNPPVIVMAGPLAPVYFEEVRTLVEKKMSVLGKEFPVVLSDMTEMPLKGAASLVLNSPILANFKLQ